MLDVLSAATYTTIQDHVDLLNHMTIEQAALQERITALESVLTNLKAGYNPNYQDMAVLEAVRGCGWDALKPEPTEAEGDAEESTEESTEAEAEPIPEPEEERWTETKIFQLKSTDPLSVLLEHERHISGPGGDEISAARKSLTLPLVTGGA